jgi:hypothetical protein
MRDVQRGTADLSTSLRFGRDDQRIDFALVGMTGFRAALSTIMSPMLIQAAIHAL